jgi:uncharacterized cupredoxin-like copper-binding protein
MRQSIFFPVSLVLATTSGLAVAQHSPHDFPPRMGGMPGMTGQTLQETARQIHEQHGHERKTQDPARSFAFGRPGAADQASRTVRLDLSDRLRISPASFSVRPGETVRIVVNNPGTLRHRLLIGDSRYQHEHSLMRQVMPSAEHRGVNALSLALGAARELIWLFSGPADVEIACHSPGHYKAGMISRIHVAPSQ